MISLLKKYSYWLHGRWPNGTVEKLPLINNDGSTNISGAYIVGDLTGTPLLKFSAQSGAQAIKTALKDKAFINRNHQQNIVDVIIIGGGVSGYSAAIEAKKAQLSYRLLEANQAFSTIENFPKGKPIYTYPSDMAPDSELQFSDAANSKEALLAELKGQISTHEINAEIANVSHIEKSRDSKKSMPVIKVFLNSGEVQLCHRVIIAIGRSGNYRKLDIDGENLDKVSNRLIDASIYQDKALLIVGGGDSALEAAIASCQQQSKVTLSYRKEQLSRAKEENIHQVHQLAAQGKINLKLGTTLSKIEDKSITLTDKKNDQEQLANDQVLLATGREAPLDFFRRSNITISGESNKISWLYFALYLIALTALYDWKAYGFLANIWNDLAFPNNMPQWLADLGPWWQGQVSDRSTLLGTLAISLKSRSFYYTVIYTALIAVFGWQRIQRRNTPYVTRQTTILFLVQLLPLFLLPEIILPYLGYNGIFDAGMGKAIADALFPSYISAQDLANHVWPDWGHPRAYWHAYSFIFAWPLGVYTVFTDQPQYTWLAIAALQTFVIIPWIVFKWGKGAYCSWICSCGGMAETLGDQHRHKMPHGKKFNNANMLGQFILAIAFILLFIRILGWAFPDTWMNQAFNLLLKGENKDYQLVNALSWKWVVDIFLAGILGFGLYFKYSGRTWCRFACPLAALMHIYSIFSRFAIVAEKSKCISCNQCTSVCHQGIDVMAFANKGQPMVDPQCVRCSACVSTCPTGTLSFAQVNKKSGKIIKRDKLSASPIQMKEALSKNKEIVQSTAQHTSQAKTADKSVNQLDIIEVKNV